MAVSVTQLRFLVTPSLSSIWIVLMGSNSQFQLLPHPTSKAKYSFFFFFGSIHRMWKFPDQGSNPSHSRGNTGSLASWATRELPKAKQMISPMEWLHSFLFYFMLFYIILFLGPNQQHLEVPRLGVESELQMPACTTATATGDLNLVFEPHHSSRQCHWVRPGIEPAY